jgi:hypothetical protein
LQGKKRVNAIEKEFVLAVEQMILGRLSVEDI